MPSPETGSAVDAQPPADFLQVLRLARILPDPLLDELRARVLSGELPFDAGSLARRLVRDQILTEYQAGRLLKNKPHGLSFGKYVILDKLGAGAMGRVYKARHLLMDRNVALKIIAPAVSNNRRGVGRFRREMQLVGRLDHPNVVRAYDADEVGNTLYIVMEYVHGESLGQILRRDGPVPPRESILYGAQAARGLGHAHAQGIVHRDVKPTNLLLGDDGRVRVLDLGLGVLVEPDPQSAFMTADGIAVGTVDYMSPEQACGKEVDGRSDVYSLGCTLFHMITGQHVFAGESKLDRMLARVEGTPRRISDFIGDAPPGLEAVMDRMLARDPDARYQSAEDAAAALEGLLADRPARPGRVPSAQALASSRPKIDEPPSELPGDDEPSDSNAGLDQLSHDYDDPEAPGWLVEFLTAYPVGSVLVGFALLALVFALGVIVGLAIHR